MKTKSDSKLSKILKNSEFSSYSGIILVIVVVCIFMTFRSSNFMTTNNILNILRQISVYGILACGMAFAMMTGGIDLTVGATAGVAGAIAALMITNGTNMVFAIVVSLLSGAVMGWLAGITIAHTGIPPFIMTLGLQITFRGVCYLVCEGKPIGNLPEGFTFLGLGNLFGIPVWDTGTNLFYDSDIYYRRHYPFKNIIRTFCICSWWKLSGCISFWY